jgi:hypothetical protein
MWGGSFLMYSQGELLSCIPGSLRAGLKVSNYFFANWSNKTAPKHILGYWPFLTTKISESLIFLMHIQRLNFTQCLYTGFGQLLWILCAFPKKHIGHYWPSWNENNLRDCSFLTWNYMIWNSIINTDKFIISLDKWCSEKMRCGSETLTVFNFDLEQLVGDIDNTVWQIT